jgi:hypothetical protein
MPSCDFWYKWEETKNVCPPVQPKKMVDASTMTEDQEKPKEKEVKTPMILPEPENESVHTKQTPKQIIRKKKPSHPRHLLYVPVERICYYTVYELLRGPYDPPFGFSYFYFD